MNPGFLCSSGFFFRSSRQIVERFLGEKIDICGGFGVFIYLLCHHPLLRFVVLLGDYLTLLRHVETFLESLLVHDVGIKRLCMTYFCSFSESSICSFHRASNGFHSVQGQS